MKKLTGKQVWINLFAFSILLTTLSCKKPANTEDMDEAARGTLSPSPVGLPVGEPYVEWIGSEGGVVKSPDGTIEIDIPEGALTQETEIGIQPLTHTSGGRMGSSYRLTPHGTILKKEITIRFSYQKQERLVSSAKVLRIAYQNHKGIWTTVSGTTIDPVQKTVSVKTTHFSDWGLISAMYLTPTITTVGLGEKVNLKALLYVHGDDVTIEKLIEDSFNDSLSVISPTDIPTKLDEKYIVGWKLSGPGQLTGKGNEATYTAPAATPSSKTATVTLELNVKGAKVLLISTIYLVEDGIQISIDGGPWTTHAGMAAKIPELPLYSLGNLRISTDLPQITIQWPAMEGSNANGQYPWSMLSDEDQHVVFEYFEPDLKHMYASIYQTGPDTKDSEGFLSVEEITKDGKKYITGVFAIDHAGYFEQSATGDQLKVSSIIGQFRVLRNW